MENKETLFQPGIVIQVRMGSTRRPEKAMAKIAPGITLTGYLIDRLLSGQPYPVYLALPKGKIEDPLRELAEKKGISWIDGPMEDVLKRYAMAARKFNLNPVMRITGDDPLVEPSYAEPLMNAWKKEPFDYGNIGGGGPRGTGIECARAQALFLADKEAQKPEEREHVMPFFYLQPERFRITRIPAPNRRIVPNPPRLTVDYPEDLELMKLLYKKNALTLDQCLTLFRKKPELFDINRHCRQKKLGE